MTTAAIEFPAPKPAPNPRGAGPTDISVIASFLKPIAHLLDDEDVTEIMGNQDGSWFYESKRFKTIQRAHIH